MVGFIPIVVLESDPKLKTKLLHPCSTVSSIRPGRLLVGDTRGSLRQGKSLRH